MTRAAPPAPVLRVFGVLVAGEGLARAAAFIATALLARRLGPDGFGVVGFAAALTAYLALVVDGGLHEMGTREVARSPARARTIYLQAASIRIVLAAAMFLGLAAGVRWLPQPEVVRTVVLLSGLSFFTLAIDASWVLRALERPTAVAAALTATHATYALGVAWAVHGPDDITAVPLLLVAGEAVGALIVAVSLGRRGRPSFPVAAGARLLWDARHIAAARVLRAMTVTFDVVLLGFVASHREVGLYAAAYRLLYLLMAVVTSIASAYMPSYARMADGGRGPLKGLLTASLETGVLIGAPLVAGTVLVAEPLLALLFGSEYRDAATALRLLALSAAFLFFHWSVRNLLVASQRGALQLKMTAAAAAVTVALDLALIPRFGITGAAFATLVTEAALAAMGLAILWRMDVRPSIGGTLRPLAATTIMSLAVWVALDRLPVLVIILGAGGIYVAALAALGVRPARALPGATAPSTPAAMGGQR